MPRYRAYQAHLAGCTIGQTIGRAVTFVTLTGANAALATDTSQRTTGSQPTLPAQPLTADADNSGAGRAPYREMTCHRVIGPGSSRQASPLACKRIGKPDALRQGETAKTERNTRTRLCHVGRGHRVQGRLHEMSQTASYGS